MEPADYIPLTTGTMIFTSVLLAGTGSVGKRRLAWLLGCLSQCLLLTFGVLTEHYTFTSHLPVALAFAFNLWRTRPRVGVTGEVHD
jgi:hypothetical protein